MRLEREYVALAGAAGLGREVRRILHVRPTIDGVDSPGVGDLIIYSSGNRPTTTSQVADRALAARVGSGVAGVLTDSAPGAAVIEMADKYGVPILSGRQDTNTAPD